MKSVVNIVFVGTYWRVRSSLFRSLLMLFAGLILTSTLNASVSPHPRVEQMVKEKQITMPYYLAHLPELHTRGINSPERLPKLAKHNNGFSSSSTGFKALAICIDFTDKRASTSADQYDTLLFGTFKSSLKNYYREISYGMLDIITVDMPSTIGWESASQQYSYYVNEQNGFGTYPRNAQKLTEEAITAADSIVDFSQYDNDGDGYVDALYIIHAGSGGEFTGSSNDIWSHTWTTSTPIISDGVKVFVYSMEPEYWLSPGDMTCGVFAHETGHALFGLPDLYDLNGDSHGLGRWSLMASGCWNGSLGNSPAHPDAWSRWKMGFVDPIIVTSEMFDAQIPAIEESSKVYRLWSKDTTGTEYFLVENRQKIGFDSQLKGAGLCIYHIDEIRAGNNNQWYPGYTSFGHYEVAMEQADGKCELEKRLSSGDAGDPYPGLSINRSFGSSTIPASLDYIGAPSNVAVNNISNSGRLMTATFFVDSISIDTIAVDTAHYITVGVSAHGSISPSGKISVPSGGSQIFTITPDTGYYISDVHVDSVSIGSVSVFEFSNITSDHSINATFSRLTYQVFVETGTGGIINPSGLSYVAHGDQQTFNIIPNLGYILDSLYIDGIHVGTTSSYTFYNVTSSHQIKAGFALTIYTIQATAGGNGDITPSGIINVFYGENQAFRIQPQSGYNIDSLFVDGIHADSLTGYTFSNVTGNCSIHVIFKQQLYPIPILTKIVNGNGYRGDSKEILILGSNFIQGKTSVIAGDGLSILSLRFSTVSLESLWANITIDSHTTPGTRNIIVLNDYPGGGSSASQSFTILNRLPVAVKMAMPSNNDTIISHGAGTVDFRWNRSIDLDKADTVKYSIHVWGSDLDTAVLSLSDTSRSLKILPLIRPEENYYWTVTATDGYGIIVPADTFKFVASIVNAIQETRSNVGKNFELYQNYPNPFNPTTSISFELSKRAIVSLKIYNVLGQLVTTLVNDEQLEKGYREVKFDASDYSSGLYFYSIKIHGLGADESGSIYYRTKEMILMK